MAGIRIQIDGTRRVILNLERIEGQTIDNTTKAMVYEMEQVMADSKENYVPVRTGTLRSSGFVAKPRFDGSRVVVEAGYGGAAQLYAILVHERPMRKGARWSPTASGAPGQRKYLQTPFLKRAPKMPENIRNWIKFLRGTTPT